jgi:8-oxo-dGTP pyrophosphatase MutT (NUDIX family)
MAECCVVGLSLLGYPSFGMVWLTFEPQDLHSTKQKATGSYNLDAMATSIFPTTQYKSEQFVESCGAVLFDLSRELKRVCLIHYLHGGNEEWLLPKGRRNRGECRRQAALREVEEETGYKCRIYPVTMVTRAPHAHDLENVADEPRLCSDLDEPFMLTVRELTPGSDVKLIWWYIVAVDESFQNSAVASNGDFKAEFFIYEDALQKLTFQKDRDILEKAITLVENC